MNHESKSEREAGAVLVILICLALVAAGASVLFYEKPKPVRLVRDCQLAQIDTILAIGRACLTLSPRDEVDAVWCDDFAYSVACPREVSR
jgi:hypothetical protein